MRSKLCALAWSLVTLSAPGVLAATPTPTINPAATNQRSLEARVLFSHALAEP